MKRFGGFSKRKYGSSAESLFWESDDDRPDGNHVDIARKLLPARNSHKIYYTEHDPRKPKLLNMIFAPSKVCSD
jgi:hypothetical protein